MEIVNELLKTILYYLVLYLVLRFMGKREVGQLGLIDLSILLIISNIIVLGIEIKDVPWHHYIWPIVLLAIIQKLTAIISLRSTKLRKIIDGKKAILVIDGKLNINEFRKQKFSLDDFIVQMRISGIKDLQEVEFCILENNGKISFLKYENDSSPFPVIVSGTIVIDNLLLINSNEQELLTLLKDKKPEDIYYASMTKDKKLFIAETM